MVQHTTNRQNSDAEAVHDEIEPGSKKTIVKPTREARQGVTGHNVRYVLYWGTGLAAFVLALVWFYYFA